MIIEGVAGDQSRAGVGVRIVQRKGWGVTVGSSLVSSKEKG